VEYVPLRASAGGMEAPIRASGREGGGYAAEFRIGRLYSLIHMYLYSSSPRLSLSRRAGGRTSSVQIARPGQVRMNRWCAPPHDGTACQRPIWGGIRAGTANVNGGE
jgi:hypothetical protein